MNTSRHQRAGRIAACTALALSAGTLLAATPASAAGSDVPPRGAVERVAPKPDRKVDLELPASVRRGTFAATGEAAAPRYDADHDGRADVLYRGIDGHYYVGSHDSSADIQVTIGQSTETLAYKDVIPVGDVHGDAASYSDLLALGADGRLSLFEGHGTLGSAFTATWSGGGWQMYNKVFSPGDLTGDGRADLLARTHAGALYLYEASGVLSSPFKSAVKIGAGWQAFDQLVGANDINGDAIADVVARNASGDLFSYLGTGVAATPFKPAAKIGTGYQIYNQLVGVDDIDGDGNGDLFARTPSGQLYLYPANGTGGVEARVALGTGFNAVTQFAGQGGVPDFDRADLFARDAAGTMWWYYSKNNGTLAKRQQVGPTAGWKGAKFSTASALRPQYGFADMLEVYSGKLYVNGEPVTSGWQIYNHVFGPGDLSGDGKGDLLARDGGGTLYLYRGNGAGTGFASRVKVGAGWGGFNKLTGAGDLTGDGRADLLARATNGDLYVYPGTGQAAVPFAARVKVGTGFGIYKNLVVTGDLTGDGRADLVATDSAGTLWRYDSYGNTKLTARAKVGTGYQIYPNLY
ncbi:FG-GAP repeat domain-containing protein [Streptomyces sp. NBC_00239]|uniref:FG-GAP repeat domain-containing protein n=1 Tax=Streptomyces sp. NBC_00239 TaxID=2903640 RepID=UPI002E2B5550|nr:VCBS repeat-containing protein [Streptomyces sp. NBC_00239]